MTLTLRVFCDVTLHSNTRVFCKVTLHSNARVFAGSDDGTIRLWEVATGRCLKTLKVSGVVKCVAWNPNPALSLVAAVV